MAKKNKWQRSDSISIIALIIAIPAIVFSSIEFFENRNESVDITMLKTNEKYWHVSEVIRTRENFYVSQITEWQKIRIGNKSKFPITIIDSYLKVDNNMYRNSLRPFFKKVIYDGKTVELIEPIEMPLKIEPNSAKEFYFPLLLPIDRSMGMAMLITSFEPKNLSEESTMASVALNNTYIDDFIKTFNSQMDSSSLKKVLNVDVEMKSLDKVTLSRPLIHELTDGYEMIDRNNNSPDGLIYREKNECIVELNEILIKNSLPVKTAFEKIEICFKTLDNNEYSLMYSSTNFWNN
ncbi:MAG: hypothetical protein KJ754_14285 [Bacteroidetes bacterium]|nr:hypothetical protein [Bacteroidota bacterium]